MRILGLDPGLQRLGWGIVTMEGSRLRGVAAGMISTNSKALLPERLAQLFDSLSKLMAEWQPGMAAVEETFVNANPQSALKLGQARGVILMAPAHCGVPVYEYAANTIKKSVAGNGHACKTQMQAMVRFLLPGLDVRQADAADALAVAICHAHHHRFPQSLPA